jgi:hypothetical protein
MSRCTTPTTSGCRSSYPSRCSHPLIWIPSYSLRGASIQLFGILVLLFRNFVFCQSVCQHLRHKHRSEILFSFTIKHRYVFTLAFSACLNILSYMSTSSPTCPTSSPACPTFCSARTAVWCCSRSWIRRWPASGSIVKRSSSVLHPRQDAIDTCRKGCMTCKIGWTCRTGCRTCKTRCKTCRRGLKLNTCKTDCSPWRLKEERFSRRLKRS